MKPIVLIVLSSTFVLFLLVQLIHPNFVSSPEPTPGDISNHLQIPQDVRETMMTSCYDCHSENTVWPWYSRIAPASWLMDRDVRMGREHLNLSHWDELAVTEQIMVLQLMCREVEMGEMPLKQYMLMHHDAKVSGGKMEAFCEWARNQAAALQGGSGE